MKLLIFYQKQILKPLSQHSNNGILEIVLKKKEQAKSGGEEIRRDRSPFFIIMSCNTTNMYGLLGAVSVSRW